MDRRLLLATAILATASGCSRGAFVPDGPLAEPLTRFERIDVRPMVNKLPKKGAAAGSTAASPDSFLQAFRRDLTSRLQKKKVLNLTNGPLVILEASLLNYRCESRPPSYEKDNLTDKATVEIQILLTDESGKRIGGGKAAAEYSSQTTDGALRGAEKRVVYAISEFLRKSAKGKAADVPDSDDPP